MTMVCLQWILLLRHTCFVLFGLWHAGVTTGSCCAQGNFEMWHMKPNVAITCKWNNKFVWKTCIDTYNKSFLLNLDFSVAGPTAPRRLMSGWHLIMTPWMWPTRLELSKLIPGLTKVDFCLDGSLFCEHWGETFEGFFFFFWKGDIWRLSSKFCGLLFGVF